jgi:hypothetical protein
MNKLETRVAALERQQQQRGQVNVVVIRGGLTGGDPTFGKAGRLYFQRAEGETFPAFQSRAVAEATAAGERLVVIGGLQE